MRPVGKEGEVSSNRTSPSSSQTAVIEFATIRQVFESGLYCCSIGQQRGTLQLLEGIGYGAYQQDENSNVWPNADKLLLSER